MMLRRANLCGALIFHQDTSVHVYECVSVCVSVCVFKPDISAKPFLMHAQHTNVVNVVIIIQWKLRRLL